MRVPWLDDDVILQHAEDFLRKYNFPRTLPLDIENIIESKSKLNIYILPTKNLETCCRVDGYISGDFRTIGIEDEVYNKQVPRARFTFAHEVGHLILHRELYENNKPKNGLEFIDFQNSLDPSDWKKLEIQAHKFAEEILLPKKELVETVFSEVENLGGLERVLITDIQEIVKTVSDTFFVSGRCAFNRMNRAFPDLMAVTDPILPPR